MTKDLPVLINERAVIRSVRNLVETIPTERYFNSILGTDIRDTLFTNFDRAEVMMIEDQIRETLGNFEPRVSNVGATVRAVPDNNTFNVTVFFDINGLDLPTQSFSFILEPTR